MTKYFLKLKYLKKKLGGVSIGRKAIGRKLNKAIGQKSIGQKSIGRKLKNPIGWNVVKPNLT